MELRYSRCNKSLRSELLLIHISLHHIIVTGAHATSEKHVLRLVLLVAYTVYILF